MTSFVSIRSSALEDIRAFNGLVNNSGGAVFYRATFGQFNFSSMVETSCISLIAMAEDNATCVAYLSVSDSPGIGKEGIAFDNTISLINEHVPEITNRNSLFVNFLLLDERPDYDMETISYQIMYDAFKAQPNMDYMIWLCPSSVKLTDWTKQNFIEPVSDALKESCESKSNLEEPLKGYRLLYAHRDQFMPHLQVRSAMIEDKDDLLPILKESNPDAVKNQGNFFLADLIQQQDNNNRFFVGVNASNDKPVAMIATSLDVNVGLITKVFDVDQYPDMFVEREKSPLPSPLVLGVVGDIRTVENSFLNDLIKTNNCAFIDAEQLSLPEMKQNGNSGSSSSSHDQDNINESKGGENNDDVYVPPIMTEIQIEQENARAMDKLVRDRIQEIAESNPENPPLFTVVKGYPRNDAEAEVVAKNPMIFDIVLDLQNPDPEVDIAPDDYIINHMDAIEALTNFLDMSNAPHWKKINMSEPDSQEELGDVFRELVLTHVNEIDDIIAKEANEPPFANAFAITVMCTKDGFESRINDMLRAVFEDHPHLDYCMFMTPNNSEKPNKLINSMVSTKLRNGVSFDQTLFVLHREALLAFDLLTVERALDLKDNKKHLINFLEPLGNIGQRVVESTEECYKFNDVNYKDNPMGIAFEVKLQDSIIGIITLTRKNIGNDDINWMRANYEIDSFVNFDRHRARSQAFISNWILSPVFGRWSRYIIREIMRKYMKTVLYYQHDKDITPPIDISNEFLPVKPRKRMQPGPGTDLPLIDRPSGSYSANCPLYQLTKNDLFLEKTTILSRIVIFAGGVASWGMLEEFCYARNYNYPNIYFISDLPIITFCINNNDGNDGNDGNKDNFSETCHGMLSSEDSACPSMNELYAYGYAHRVHYIQGRLTDIDRENKAIIVSDELVVEYDILTLASTTKDKSFKKIPAISGMHSSFCEKRGIFGLGDAYTDKLAYTWAEKQEKAKWPIVVYGNVMDVSACVGSLIQYGIASRRITIIIPSDDMPENCHPTMNECIIRTLRASGCILHRGHDIIDVTLSNYGTIESCTIKNTSESENIPVTIDCFSLLTCLSKHCDLDIFAAVNDCGIVYDGGIVVNKDFCTVDPSIYAVGDFSRYSRIYSKEPQHKSNNCYEMGLYVARTILTKHLNFPISISMIPENENVQLNTASVPRFYLPRTTIQYMPCDKFYFNSKLANSYEDTNVLISGDIKTDNLCALKLDSFGRVVEICFVGKTLIEHKNVSKFVGMHESFLNSALYSYEEGKIDDWIDWFRGEWSTALFHDKLSLMNSNIRSSLSTDKGTYTILDKVTDAIEKSTDNDKVTENWSELIGPHGSKLDTATRRIVETQTIDYLKTNKVMLNRFQLPQPKKSASAAAKSD
jgi:hypothetical protein